VGPGDLFVLDVLTLARNTMKLERIEAARIVTEENARVFTGKYLVNLPIRNPVKVIDLDGKILGAANLEFVNGALQVEMNIGKGTPEAFDMEVNPDRIEMSLTGIIDDDGIDAAITLKTR
jgi:hypothetical protein